ncbi:MAG TPA: molybdopterin-dependent oxidoreductase, partial [Candidatus Aphodovivens excrementavium]|nr:molybdopterin-dependent oxidoreductase [Candidatus Aphodovivens excrementavium]
MGTPSMKGVPNNTVDENGIRWRRTRCHFCHMNCGIFAGVDTKTGRLVELRPNDDEGSVLCNRLGERGQRAIKFHYHPKRINHPLKRVGERGEDKWEQISYDQAIKEIAEKLQALIDKYGPETLVSSEGTYRSDHLWARSRFTNALGNPGNVIDPGTICWCWNYTLNMAMVGWPVESMMPVSPGQSKTIVNWGKRTQESYAPEAPLWRVIDGKTNVHQDDPAQLIVIDPVCISECGRSDIWLQPYPNTDAIICYAWINYIINNKLYDENFLRYWSNAVFLWRRDTGKLLRASDVEESGKFEDFVVWDAERDGILTWCSDENRYYTDEGVVVDAQLTGNYTVKLVDGSEVECCTIFDIISERMQEYTPKRASEISGVPKRKIEEAAHLYATNGAACIIWGLGGGDMHGLNASGFAIGKTILRILTGNIDNPGGEFVGQPADPNTVGKVKDYPMRNAEMELSELQTEENKKKFIGADRFRVMAWPGFDKIDKNYRKMFGTPRPMLHQMLCSPSLVMDAMIDHDPYPITAMIAWSSNPLAWAPNTKKMYKALKSLELLVVVEYWKTPTAALADYIMPAEDWMGRPMCTTSEDSMDFITVGDRGVECFEERHADFDFFRLLGRAMGQEEYWPWETYEECIQSQIERCGLDYEDVVNMGQYFPYPTEYYKYARRLENGQIQGFATSSRKAEMYPALIEELGYDPIPRYIEPESPLSDPEMAKEYPLRLTTAGRISPLFHSEHRTPGEGTRTSCPYPMTWMHYNDARKLGIAEGDWIWIETPVGRIRQQAHLGWDIPEGVVQVPPSWWYPELPAEEPWSQGVFDAAANVLIDDDPDKADQMTATWCTRGLLCKVYPCIDPRDRSDDAIPADLYDGTNNTVWDKAYANLSNWRLEK